MASSSHPRPVGPAPGASGAPSASAPDPHAVSAARAVEAAPACAGPPRLPVAQAEAWLGFLASHAQMTRALDAGLSQRFGLSLSETEVLTRIAWERSERLRMSDLADEAGLSQSRVSRIIDALTRRELVVREICPSDSRGVFARLTDPGRELAHSAMEWYQEQVQAQFFGSLTERQVRELGVVWRNVLGERVLGERATPPLKAAD